MAQRDASTPLNSMWHLNTVTESDFMDEDEEFMSTLLRQREASAKLRTQQVETRSQASSVMQVEEDELQVEPFQRGQVGDQIPLSDALAGASTVVAGGEIIGVTNGTVYFKDERTYHTNVGVQSYSSTAATRRKGLESITVADFTSAGMIAAPTKTEPTSDQRSVTLSSTSSGPHQIIIPHGGVDNSMYDEEFGKAIHQYTMTQLTFAGTGSEKIQNTTCTLIKDSDYHIRRTGEVTLNFNVGNYRGREFVNKFNVVRRCECEADPCVCV